MNEGGRRGLDVAGATFTLVVLQGWSCCPGKKLVLSCGPSFAEVSLCARYASQPNSLGGGLCISGSKHVCKFGLKDAYDQDPGSNTSLRACDRLGCYFYLCDVDNVN